MRSTLVVLTLTLVAASAGCLPAKDDSANGDGQALIELQPSSLHFGAVPVGQSGTVELTILSTGDAAVQIDEVCIEGATSVAVDLEGVLGQLPPGASTTAAVTYTPANYELVTGELVVVSGTAPDATAPLTATGDAPMLELEPETLDFGEVQTGCHLELELTLRNVGSAPLQIQDVSLEADSDELSLGDTPDTVEAGDAQTVTVIYEAQDEYADEGLVFVTSDDPLTPVVTVPLAGTGSLGTEVEDEYEQELGNSTDILWVVDNSTSLDLEMESLQGVQALFQDYLNMQGIDYHLAAVTTDDASLLGDIVSPGNNGDAFSGFQVVDEAQTTEQGLLVGWQALSSPLTDPGGANDGFLRDAAGLRVIYLSDEEDQSPSTVTDYVTNYQSLKVNTDHVVLSAIVDPQAGQRYDQAASMTGGLSEDIWDPNTLNTLANLANLANHLSDTFELSQVPLEHTVFVEINGLEALSGWAFDANLNAVVFEPLSIPQTGDTIVIRYTRVTDCP